MVHEHNDKVEVNVYGSRRDAEEGCVPLTVRGTVPQGIRFLVDRLDNGIDRAQEILDDMKRDRDALRRKHGV